MRQQQRSSTGGLLRVMLTLLGLVAIAIGVHNAQANEADLRRIPFPASKAERAKGVVRGLATFHPGGTFPVPPCIAGWKSGKNTKHTHFSGDNRVELEGGETYELSETQKIELFRNEPPRRPTGGDAATVSYLQRIKPDVREFQSIRCLSETEAVWVEACTKGKTLIGCDAPQDPILLTVGGPSVRATYLTSHAQGALALIVLGAVLALLGVTAWFVHLRAVVKLLARKRGVSPPGVLLFVYIAIGAVGSLASSFAWTTIYGPWFFCVFVAIFFSSVAVLVVTRLRTLGAARRILLDTETSGLADAAAPDRELAVRVAPDAPQVEGFRHGEQHAIVRFRIVEGWAFKSSNNKTSVHEREVVASGYPKYIPILDGTGRGVLAIEHCRIDGGAEPPITWQDGMPSAPSWLASAIGTLPRSETHRYYRAEWVVAERDDPLLIYGGVDRVLPSSVGVPDGAAYRFDPNIPLVRGRDGDPAFAYVGLESSLLAALARERAALALALLAGAGAVAATWVSFAWIVKQ